MDPVYLSRAVLQPGGVSVVAFPGRRGGDPRLLLFTLY
jgi:hypothetical protein